MALDNYVQREFDFGEENRPEISGMKKTKTIPRVKSKEHGLVRNIIVSLATLGTPIIGIPTAYAFLAYLSLLHPTNPYPWFYKIRPKLAVEKIDKKPELLMIGYTNESEIIMNPRPDKDGAYLEFGSVDHWYKKTEQGKFERVKKDKKAEDDCGEPS